MEVLKMVYSKNWMARQGKKWTEEDMHKLLDLYAAGVRWGLIAQELQRSVPSCVNRLRAMRFWHNQQNIFNYISPSYSEEKMEVKERL